MCIKFLASLNDVACVPIILEEFLHIFILKGNEPLHFSLSMLAGLALLDFKRNVQDPGRALQSWNETDSTPCKWRGIGCRQNSSQVLTLCVPSQPISFFIMRKLVQHSYRYKPRSFIRLILSLNTLLSSFSSIFQVSWSISLALLAICRENRVILYVS